MNNSPNPRGHTSQPPRFDTPTTMQPGSVPAKSSPAVRMPPHRATRRSMIYFSLLGGVRPFSRRYRASVAYCS